MFVVERRYMKRYRLFESNLNRLPKNNDITIPDMRTLELQKIVDIMEEPCAFN